MSGKALERSLSSLDMTCDDIDALLVTHEHIDHTKGIGIVSRRYNIPIYATNGTFLTANLGNLSEDNINPISSDTDFEIGDIGIKPFEISHDAAEPVGFTFFTGHKKRAIITDSGIINDKIWSAISGSAEVILESNHDSDMLMYGIYPMNLKRRIASDIGHLSNSTAANIALKLLKSGTKKIMLGHLSKENNTPAIAYQTTKNVLEACGTIIGKDILLSVADRYNITRF